MAGEAHGEVVVPPTLQALLAARLDQLETAERSVLERGAIEGEIFHRGAVQALAPEETQVTPRLAALVRKELIRPDRSPLASEDGFRFRHLLIRDAAYDALPKATRAELHGRFATWLMEHGTELVEFDEVVGYHLELACNYRAELGHAPRRRTGRGCAPPPDRRRPPRAPSGGLRRRRQAARARRLTRTTGRARPRPRNRPHRRPVLGRQRERRAPARRFRRRTGLGCGDQVSELCGRIQAGIIRMSLEPEGAGREAGGAARAGAAGIRGCGPRPRPPHRIPGSRASRVRACADGRGAGGIRAGCRVRFDGGHVAGVPRMARRVPLLRHDTRVGSAGVAGRARATSGADHWLRMYRALALAMLGRFDEARPMLAGTRAELAERGGGIRLAVTTGIESVDFELLAGDPAVAAELGAEGCRLLEELGDKSFLSTAAASLARALFALDRLEEADAWAGRAEELGASEDAATQRLWRQVRAKVLGAPRRARRGGAARARGGGDRRRNGRSERTGRRVRRPRRRAPAGRKARRGGRRARARRSSATSARATSFRRSARRLDSQRSETKRRKPP